MIKLNDLVRTCKLTAYGFGAFRALEAKSNPDGPEAVIATDSPAIMYQRGINAYYAPVIPRNSRFTTADEVLAADLDAQLVTVNDAPSWDKVNPDHIIIVSRHPGTVEILKQMYPQAPVLASVTPEQIRGCHVIGTLPPSLISECMSYRAVTIRDFDYARDGDLAGNELRERLIICDPITVTAH